MEALTAAEAPLALLELAYGVEEVGVEEVGPEFGEDDDFGVADLPEEEVGEAHFAAGADEEFGIGVVSGVEVLAEGGGVEGGGVEGAGLGFVAEGADGIEDLFAGAVAEGEDHGEAGVVAGGGDGGVELLAAGVGKLGESADGLEADVFLHEGGGFFDEELI